MTVRDLIEWGTRKDRAIAPRGHDWLDVPTFADIDEIARRLLRGLDLDLAGGRVFAGFSPDIDITEGEKEYKITAELPGLEEKDIELTVEHDTLTIRGEKKEEHEETKGGYTRRERSYGAFTRSVLLPPETEPGKIEAEYKKGVLTVKLPKSEKAVEQAKKIDIKTA